MSNIQKAQNPTVLNSSSMTSQSTLPSTTISPSFSPPDINVRDAAHREVQSPEIKKQFQEFVQQNLEGIANQNAKPTRMEAKSKKHGAAESFGKKSDTPASSKAQKQQIEGVKSQISEKKTEILLEKMISQAEPPLTEQQATALKKIMAGMPEKMQKAWLNDANKEQVVSRLLGLARSGQLERLAEKLNGNENEKSLKLMAFGMMMAHPERAKEITDTALDARTSLLGLNFGRAGKELQMAALALAARGHDTKGLLADKTFAKMSAHEKMVIMSQVFDGKATKEQIFAIHEKKEQIEKSIHNFQASSSRQDKTAFLTKLAENITAEPKAFALLSPATQQVLAGILVQRVGFDGGKGADHDRACVAMVALKASDPESYRKLFSPLVDAAKQGPQAIKDHVQKALKDIAAGDAVAAGAGLVAQGIVTKLTSGISASGGAAGVAIGLVVGVAWGASSGRGVEAVTNAAAAFATGGLAAAISTTVATAGVAGMGIGLAIGAAPAALVALWSAYCERGVSQQQTNESVKQMTQNESIRP